ncbi:hypothetical protein ASG47_12725 [Devosia sp. Leaf420]|uniref:glycosyltransferase n=1 Tax=Devosia sp. Leaf420 TaxID=1736374 RepID=UPI0007147B6D|nr:glycosyltransferase [Devosia sp. Leaf420]KQT45806.1 hypothetical protein ASG47_12725 [Devosia sp. Leaf420]
MLKILYLVPNLSDPAAGRRVAMFQLGGADVELAGFRRADAPPSSLPVEMVVELDVTHDARMLQRLLATVKARYTARGWARRFSRPDVIVARNLEMLAIAEHLLQLWPDPPALVYECLDIHRLMLREDGVGRAMRSVEQRLMQPASLLLTSSPAFLSQYFDEQGAPPARLIENKVFAPSFPETGRNPGLALDDEGPLRLGWFGALRCARSLDILEALSTELGGKLEVTLRGRPALVEFDDFHRTANGARHLSFEGPYVYPDDLATIYSGVHFVWAIDFFEEGQNSSWLLPNRIYEGCLNGAIPIALKGTETAAFIARHGIGIVIDDVEISALVELFAGMSRKRVRELARAVADKDKSHFRCEEDECVALVKKLGALAGMSAMEMAA